MPKSKIKVSKISINVRVPKKWEKPIDKLVKIHGFTSRSDLLRALLRKELEKRGLLEGVESGF